jgi:hypothetical protein
MTELTLEAQTERIQYVLALLTSEQAVEIIGEQTPEYRKLVEGAESLGVLWSALVRSGDTFTDDEKLKQAAQAQMVLLTLVHYTYALGIRHGRVSP